MKLYGLIGYPLSHSFSKKFFSDKFRQEGLTGYDYQNFAISSIHEFKSLLLNTPSLHGLNVTIPYKEKILSFLHEKNEVVRSTGACNCIKISNGRLYGYNTDTIGFEKALKEKLLPHHRNALVLGTGGSSKAIGYVMNKLQIDFLYVSRSRSGPNCLLYNDITDELLQTYTLIINTTPAGMFPEINSAPIINYNMLTPMHYLFDLVYNPEKTVFLQRGEEKGATIQNGYAMLIFQAEESWKIWNNPVS